MNGPNHYAEAEDFLTFAGNQEPSAPEATTGALLAVGHGLLAVAAAIAEVVLATDHSDGNTTEWAQVIAS